MQKTRPCFTQEEKLTVRKWNGIKRICKYQNFKFYDIISYFCDDTCLWKALTWKQVIICRVYMAGRVLLAVFFRLAASMEDQIEVEGWESSSWSRWLLHRRVYNRIEENWVQGQMVRICWANLGDEQRNSCFYPVGFTCK